MTIQMIVISGGIINPPANPMDCLEAIWSGGATCRHCQVSECERYGMPDLLEKDRKDSKFKTTTY